MLQKLYHSSYMAGKFGIKTGTAGGKDAEGRNGAGKEDVGKNLFIAGNLQTANKIISFFFTSIK